MELLKNSLNSNAIELKTITYLDGGCGINLITDARGIEDGYHAGTKNEIDFELSIDDSHSDKGEKFLCAMSRDEVENFIENLKILLDLTK